MKKALLAYIPAAVILGFVPHAAGAADISYDYIQFTYDSITDSSLTSGDVDATGLNLDGSFGVTDNIALTAGYGKVDYETILSYDLEMSGFTFGITGHIPLTDKLDLLGNFSFLSAEAKISGPGGSDSDSDTGNVISAGVRFRATESIELDAGGSRTDIFDDTSNAFGFGARFYATNKFSIGVGYTTGDDVKAISGNLRYDFK